MKEPAKRILGIVLLAAALWPLFYKLGEAPLRAWDESLFAMRAYYAVEEGGYLPNFDYYPGITFYRNLKPPFGTWWQALSYRMFGYDEWALRLPVAVFSALLVAMLWFWRRVAPDLPYSGVAAGWILVLSPGFLRDHVARTGDHDAILGDLFFGPTLLFFFVDMTPEKWWWFFVGGILGGVVYLAFFVLAGSLAFYVGSSEGISSGIGNALIHFSTYPTRIFDGWTRVVLFTLIPAGFIAEVPVEMVRRFQWGDLGLLLLGTAAFSSLAWLVFHRGLRKYESGNLIVMRS